MSDRIVHLSESTASIGPCVLALGVFDGVHQGHQALLGDARKEAGVLGVPCVALTFDRDPDQVITPDQAAAQLLPLADKCELLLEAGADVVAVVPFTHELAAMDPTEFLDSLVASLCDPRAIHVGSDFRFGHKAKGDITTLESWLVPRRGVVRAQPLHTCEGSVVTSTRIRELVARGDVDAAARLLTRPTRLRGTVVRGREEGASLGFPTANIKPYPFSALPADGIYAGRARLADACTRPAAISVGVPPTFPGARDHLEAHLIDFEGDLYGQEVMLEFVERVREQRAFASLAELTAAIAADVEAIRAMLAQAPDHETFELNPARDLAHKLAHSLGLDQQGEVADATRVDGEVSDPEALERAEAAVAAMDPQQAYESATEPWTELAGPRRISGLLGNAGFNASLITAPLHAANIPFVWDPYPPEEMPSFRPAYGVFDRPFTLMVPQSRLEEAESVMERAMNGHATVRQWLPETDAPWADDFAAADHETPPAHPPAARPRPSWRVTALTWLVVVAALVAWLLRSRMWYTS